MSSPAAAATSGAPVQYVASAKLPTPWAVFQIHAFSEPARGKEHIVLSLGDLSTEAPVLTRIHSECLTGDALFSQRCDCGAQLEAALKRIADEGRGMLLYLRQEGRGIGLLNKIRAYALQDQGLDTVEANQKLGFAPDGRHFELVQPIFEHFHVHRVRLMTNNPEKVAALQALGIEVTEHIPLQVNLNPYNEFYLRTKARKMGHHFEDYFGDKP